ncbi:NADPH-dependent ferric siderophore reductase, contains FAD-binding and SIP domains [Klenkia marina]|uniref:NADPH-dependent ferric siderophore reductase, contains FAD-binding and SIP domains n=1 Tax=Klenkia marina TaxID=1960309 RepID=A0A1G4X9Z2_9ACTN|nr:siderophore-interacting protein [Klenkia marina]SCX37478.1 NADPH-dependent ferric siderophore reductase, contains FAD-binding and SIP domains [Klenkia marina]
MTQATKKKRVTRVGTVVRAERLTPHLVRVVLGGEGLAGFGAGEFTDHYVKLQFPAPGAPYAAPFDAEVVQAEQPREHWPVTRTYTVRAWEPGPGELTIDFVVHGDEGVAGPWAASARPGDLLQLAGPGGAYAPSPDADWHLLVGDDSALPAIAAALPRLPAGAPAHVFVEVEGAGDEQHLPGVVWVHRGDRPVGSALTAAVLSAELPDGVPHVFVHGEAGFVRELRRAVRARYEVPRELLSVSGYWRTGRTEEGWRADKPAWNAAVESDEAALAV